VELNGGLLPLHQASVAVTDQGLLYGVGLFETFRAYAGRVFRLPDHCARLEASAKRLDLFATDCAAAHDPCASAVQIPHPNEGRIRALLEANGLGDARIRLTVTGGTPEQTVPRPTVLITAVPLQPYPQAAYQGGISVRICEHPQVAHDPFVGHKVTHCWPRLRALRRARCNGFGEALWFTETTHLAEGCVSNVFIVRQGAVMTPPLDSPVLPGITRAVVLELCTRLRIPFAESAIDHDALLSADEIFLTNSLLEIVPVSRVENKDIGSQRVGPLTRTLLQAYRRQVREETGAELKN
jgi:branched-subunit amino acid aminotransferase/4-amino-4-deoxychorismate lyase